jgi:nicotinamidase-related amidase
MRTSHHRSGRTDPPLHIHTATPHLARDSGCLGWRRPALDYTSDDYPVLKPRHSAFYGTPLEFLFDELGVRALIITGIAADNCVLFTAHDAYLRRLELWIPRDCVASVRDEDRSRALLHMRRVLKADVRASRAAGLATPNRAKPRGGAHRGRK